MYTKNQQHGFTLIELLVVIAIIGVLASVILTSLNTARSKARDAQRRSDAHQITLAIESYFSTNGAYPVSGGATAPNGAWSNSSDGSWATVGTILASYIPSLPKDPQQSANTAIWAVSAGGGNAYSYINCGKNYMFIYHLENANGADAGTYCGGSFYQYGGAGANTIIKTIGSGY
jgi:prepilin-type N-terminal cleavage/methylation domain-containing protein